MKLLFVIAFMFAQSLLAKSSEQAEVLVATAGVISREGVVKLGEPPVNLSVGDGNYVCPGCAAATTLNVPQEKPTDAYRSDTCAALNTPCVKAEATQTPGADSGG